MEFNWNLHLETRCWFKLSISTKAFQNCLNTNHTKHQQNELTKPSHSLISFSPPDRSIPDSMERRPSAAHRSDATINILRPTTHRPSAPHQRPTTIIIILRNTINSLASWMASALATTIVAATCHHRMVVCKRAYRSPSKRRKWWMRCTIRAARINWTRSIIRSGATQGDERSSLGRSQIPNRMPFISSADVICITYNNTSKRTRRRRSRTAWTREAEAFPRVSLNRTATFTGTTIELLGPTFTVHNRDNQFKCLSKSPHPFDRRWICRACWCAFAFMCWRGSWRLPHETTDNGRTSYWNCKDPFFEDIFVR